MSNKWDTGFNKALYAWTAVVTRKRVDLRCWCFMIIGECSVGCFLREIIDTQPYIQFSSVQLLSRVRLCNPMNHSTPGLPVHHQLPEFTQSHVHRVGDAIQPSHPLCRPLLLLPPIPLSIRVFSNEYLLNIHTNSK